MSRFSRRQFALGSLALGAIAVTRPAAFGQQKNAPVVPGTGIRIARTGDDFEAEDWAYYPQHPKSSWETDDNVRTPGGYSKNLLWAEGAKRGTPDDVREELGDVLLQVVLHARLAEDLPEDERWSVDDVAAGLVDKMVRRNPHVFAGETVGPVDEIVAHGASSLALAAGRSQSAEYEQ